ncbi:MAG TPA: N-acetyltransferase [Candidatus Acidoferrales bacterium]|nr:N-acetyltransferase [Candidatus Acidoferrales bacterium]
MKVTLRSYRPGDFETLHRIDQACYPSDTAYSQAELRTYMGFVGADCLVAEIAGEPVAQCNSVGAARIAGFCITARRGAHGHIITMDVLAEFRRSGIGTALLAEAERRLAAAGVQRVGLETATDNAAGIAFWQKRQYTSVGVKKGYYAGRRDAYYMTKALAPEAARETERAPSRACARRKPPAGRAKR